MTSIGAYPVVRSSVRYEHSHDQVNFGRVLDSADRVVGEKSL